MKVQPAICKFSAPTRHVSWRHAANTRRAVSAALSTVSCAPVLRPRQFCVQSERRSLLLTRVEHGLGQLGTTAARGDSSASAQGLCVLPSASSSALNEEDRVAWLVVAAPKGCGPPLAGPCWLVCGSTASVSCDAVAGRSKGAACSGKTAVNFDAGTGLRARYPACGEVHALQGKAGDPGTGLATCASWASVSTAAQARRTNAIFKRASRGECVQSCLASLRPVGAEISL